MSEDQKKPAKKWYKKWRVYLFIFLPVIMLMIASLWVMSIGGSLSPTPENVYDNTKEELQNAITDYQNQNDGALPTINGTITINGSLCHIIDICSVLASQSSKLQYNPDGCISINGSNNDNCDGGCEGCREYSHYIWAVDEAGNVYSTCVGSDCNVNNIDGYQGVFP